MKTVFSYLIISLIIARQPFAICGTSNSIFHFRLACPEKNVQFIAKQAIL